MLPYLFSLLFWFVPERVHADIPIPVRIEQIAVIAKLDIPVEQDFSTTTLRAYAIAEAKKNGLNVSRFIGTISCESSWIWNATSTTNDFGVVQINKDAHPDVSLSQMLDPYWSISWAAQAWKDGHASWWVCYNRTYGK